MEEDDLTTAWNKVLDWIAFGLLKEGFEGIILHPLGKYALSSTFLSRATFSSNDFNYRKVAASLPGWTNDPDQNILDEFFSYESQRDSSLPKDDFRRLECQSVVEDIVFSASRWTRTKKLRAVGLELLKSIVNRTFSGQYWNTSSYAMVTICRYSPPYAKNLLDAFYDFAHQGFVDHPSNPSLTQERTYSENLINNDKATLNSIENSLIEKDKAAKVKIKKEHRPLIDDLIRAAKNYEKITRRSSE
jgi:hypothetical protein